MNETQVLIVGAGPTGLVLAVWLTRLGVRVRIIDRTPEAAPFSRALGVQARTLELYRQMGIAEGIVAGGVQVPGINLWVRGTRKARVPFRNIGQGLTPFPFVLDFAQDAHERLLIEHLSSMGVRVERQTELLCVASELDFVEATVKRSDGSEETWRAAYLAACDGAHSTARRALNIRYVGGMYTQLFYVADVTASGPAIDGELHLELDRADLLAMFPMSGRGHVRLVGTVRDESGQLERDLTFKDVSNRALSQLKLNISEVNWFSPYRVHHRIAECFRKGKVFLLGDAAHIHSPVGAQGMNTGIGDAVNLGWKLAAVLNGCAPENLLDSYALERMAFARRLVATTDRIFTFVTKRGPIARRVRTILFPLLAPLLMRIPVIRRFFFRTISQLAINYRASPLSAGAGDGVRGGDRLPWVLISGNRDFEDNYAPLSSLRWQVHVYGEPCARVAAVCAELRLPLHTFAWSPNMKRSGLRRGALYLVRPDGYIALSDRRASANKLRAYWTTSGFEAGEHP